MKLIRIIVGLFLLCCPFVCTSQATIIANSVSEFSGTQGQDNWFYGYYDGPFTTSDFQQMSQFFTDVWFVQEGSGGYWTYLTANGGHPNGTVTSGGRLPVEQWAVRRWVSEVNGTITITGNLADAHGGAGDGIVGYIFIDGAEAFMHTINDGDSTGVDYNVNAAVTVGSIVDFAIAPRSSDWTDTTRFTAVIIPEPATLLLLGLGGLLLRRRKRA